MIKYKLLVMSKYDFYLFIINLAINTCSLQPKVIKCEYMCMGHGQDNLAPFTSIHF